jgi:hypothetical protein
MSTASRLFAFCLTGALSSAVCAQNPAGPTATPAPSPPKEPHAVKIYTAKHASPADLAKTLARLYEGPLLRSVASMSGNSVVVSGRANDVDEALHVLEALDFRPEVVGVELLIVGSGETPLDPKVFVGTGAEVLAALEKLKKDGVTVRRIALDGIEGQPATKQTGEDRAFVSSTTGASDRPPGARPATRSYDRRNLGTLVEATPRVRPDGRIALDLKIEDSRMVPADGPDALPSFTTESFKGSVAVTPNQVQVVSSSDEARSKGQRTAFAVIARVVDAAAK